MRYTCKFTNGYWKTFDTHCFEDVQMHDSEKAAAAHAAKMNAAR